MQYVTNLNWNKVRSVIGQQMRKSLGHNGLDPSVCSSNFHLHIVTDDDNFYIPYHAIEDLRMVYLEAGDESNDVARPEAA